jgi:hypothetical protein
MTEDQLTDLMQEVEDSLVEDSPDQAAEALATLADSWAKAGFPYQSFLDIRQHLVQSATQRTAPAFIKQKLERAETYLRKKRDDRDNPSKSSTIN